ncbi:TonB-dependent receptor [Candidatus Methylomirabilis sp.]|uniref:TonB-dependent receptor family protein n=1 Tax=Candidatus Methylomirabilis sp. TaxID=2032687 RepID=UPI002A68EF40|nr:TonB-dependent receptor [Candidatus Methylomirabilis sp.]
MGRRGCKCTRTCTATLVGLITLLAWGAFAGERVVWAQLQTTPDPKQVAQKVQRRQELLRQLEQIEKELQALDPEEKARAASPASAATASQPVAPPTPGEPLVLEPVKVLATRMEEKPVGRAVSTVEQEEIEHARAFSVKELIEVTPGVFLKEGNGPRDVGISIRGSGAKTTFGIRNIKVFDDWFPTTQPDGLARTDLNDPHAYEGIDVLRGPSSALYDNYALGGVINFRTRKGRDIRGVEVGNEGGSYGYSNHYVHIGDQLDKFEYSLFGSHVRGDGFLAHSKFNTTTENLVATYTPDDKRSITLKFINNDVDTKVPNRLTLAEFRANPWGAGRTFVTGKGFVTAQQADQGRNDNRTIVGARYEQQLDAQTGFRLLGSYDYKDINQTFGTIGDNENPSFNFYADITREGSLLGLAAKHYAGFFFNRIEQESSTFFNLADGHGSRGDLQANTRGHIRNLGGRVREEVQFSPRWTGYLGVGVEGSEIRAEVRSRNSTTAPLTNVDVRRDFVSVAPEAGVIYSVNPDLQFRGRVATAYGIPGIGNLTTATTGLAGNNTGLKPQRNVGVELGIDVRPLPTVTASLTGYYEFSFNEFITQSPGAGLSSFTSNAPNAEHRGIEAELAWRPFAGAKVSTSYTFNDHIYTEFTENICSSTTCKSFDRSGNKIPGVERHILNARLAYDTSHYSEWWRGVGGWIEVNWLDDFYVNNSNTLKTLPYQLVNLNLHYDREVTIPFVRSLSAFFEIQNLFDATYIASANVVADALSDTPANLATSKQAFFAGQPRSYFAGLKLRF